MARSDIEAVSVAFAVTIDGHNLGAFTACDGIGVEVTIEEREEGGNNLWVHKLPGRLKYTNVKLTRAVNTDTQKVADWFSSMSKGVVRTNGEIVAMTAEGTRVATWNLTGIIPVRWTGPQLSTDSAKVATETLELAHHGFVALGGVKV
jgi:phage tail-like protein